MKWRIKVIKASNLTRMSEDWLYDKLEELEESKNNLKLMKQISDELDKRAELYNKKVEAEKEKKRIEEQCRQQLLQEFEDIKEKNGSRITMRAMAEEFGDNYDGDYYIDNNYTIYSMCGSTMNINESWGCDDYVSATKKKNQLIYYRVYNDYFRYGATPDILDRLRSKIIQILKLQVKNDNKKSEKLPQSS